MRKLLFSLSLTLLLSGCSSASVHPSAIFNNEEIKIVTATDIHYLTDRLNDKGAFITDLLLYGDGKNTLEINNLLDQWIDEVIDLKPHMVVLTGDLTFNGELKSHQDLVEKLSRFKDHNIEVIVLAGNHDIESYAVKFDGDQYYVDDITSEDDFKKIYQDYGFNQAHSKDDVSLSYSVVLNDKIKLLMIDGQSLRTKKDTFKWLESEANDARANNQTVISFSHYNMVEHFPMFGFGYTYVKAEQILEALNLESLVNFSGHIHAQHIVEKDNYTDIATGSFALSPYRYGIITIAPDLKLNYEAKSLTMDHQQRASADAYLDNVNRIKFEEMLYDYQGSDKEEMIDFGLMINRNFFQGTIEETMIDNQSYQKWVDSEMFWGRYFNQIFEYTKGDQLNYQINLKRAQ